MKQTYSVTKIEKANRAKGKNRIKIKLDGRRTFIKISQKNGSNQDKVKQI